MTPLIALALQSESPYRLRVDPREGLRVEVRGVPVIDGTWFQMYEPDWSKQHLGSGRGGTVETQADGTIQLTVRSEDGQAVATQTFTPQGDRLKVRYRFDWAGEKAVKVEATAGLVLAPAVQAGTLVAGETRVALANRPSPAGASLDVRRLAPDGSSFRFEAPLAEVEATATRPLTIFDARNYDQAWAKNRLLFWLGVLSADVEPGKALEYEVDWRFKAGASPEAKVQRLDLSTAPIADAEAPDETPMPLIPKPKSAKLDPSKPVEITGAYRFPVGRVRFWDLFQRGLANRFVMPTPDPKGKPLTFDAGVSKLDRRPGGYEITIRTDGRVSVLGEEDEGLRNGLRRLASLAFVRDGRLWLPTGTLQDEPTLEWRGVHLFVGPQAPAFHAKLWDRVLLPLGFNQAVLQVERTQWKSTPLDPSLEPMTTAGLAALFAAYRKHGIEPIPLIQSLGHMEWFFAGGKRLGWAVNREAPYTLDLRQPEAVIALGALWREAAELLRPKVMHFGADEIDMRGFPSPSGPLATELWTAAMPEFKKIAQAHDAKMMIWGDQALAPGEAPDAALAPSKEAAAIRRGLIPRGAWIGDWHYKDDPRPETFYPALQVWKRDGLRPIATGWYRPGNVRGLTLAADLERVGYLQTTWAGYQSSEATMLQNLDQFTAMVLAGDYAWSGRQEAVDKLGYDPAEVFRRLYFGRRVPVRPVAGNGLGDGKPFRVGNLSFRGFEPVLLRSALTGEGVKAPSEVEIPVRGSVARVSLALEAAVEAPDDEPVAELVAEFATGSPVRVPIRYGRHLRGANDGRMTPYAVRDGALFATVLELGKRGELRTLRLRSVGAYGGVRLRGVSTW
jgi:hypothetical protein